MAMKRTDDFTARADLNSTRGLMRFKQRVSGEKKWRSAHIRTERAAAIRKRRILPMVEHKIVPTRDGYSVRIYDAPAGGIRMLFGQKDGAINIYTKYEDAVTDVRIYDCVDKTLLFDAELGGYLQAARIGVALSDCGLSSLVRFGRMDQ
jgi:hypothetical protein